MEGLLNTENRTYTTGAGVVFTLRPVSSVMVGSIKADRFGMPQPPVVNTFVGPKKKMISEPNPNDPDYLARLNEWEEAHNKRLMVYVFNKGIVDDPTRAEIERLREYIPSANKAELKFNWVCESLGSDYEIETLARAIMGQTIPTAAGVGDAEASFSDNGERGGDQELSTTETAS